MIQGPFFKKICFYCILCTVYIYLWSSSAGCGSGTVCPRMLKNSAFCDQCDFDQYTHMCGSVKGYISETPTPAPPNPSDDCVVSEEKIYTGLYTDFLGML